MRLIFLLIGLIGLSNFVRGAAEADLLVAYDNTHSDSVGGDANAEVLALNAVAAANLISERSGSPARMRICGYHKTWWQQSRSTLGGYVGWMANPGDGELDDVTAAADARGADLVAFICQSSDPQYSGVAQQPGRYAAYQPNSFWGNVVAHETGGHNYGLAHEVGRADPKTIMMHNYCGGGSQGYYSNPNLRLNGVKLLGEGSCLGGAQQGGDAAYHLSVIAQEVADRNSRVTVAPNLGNVVRRWRFDQPAGSAPNGTTILDSIGGSASVTVVGAGASYSGEGITLPGGAPGSGAAYLDLPAGLTDAYTNLTLEVWATPLSARNWARILDLNDGTNANYLMVASSVGTDLNTQRFESNVAGTSKLIESALPTVPGMPHHYVVTFQDNGGGGGTWFHYRDGEIVARLDVGYNLSSFPDTSAWLGRSAWWASDDLGHCEYAEVRLSDVAMTRDQIQANYLLGPNFVSAPAVTMTASDPANGWGANSFATAGTWSNGLTPSAGNDYETYGHTLWTPRDGGSHTFAGDSLRLSGGAMLWNNWADSALTINDFKLNGAAVVNLGLYEFRTLTVAGNLTVENDSQIRAQGGEINLSADLGGTGELLFTDNWVTLSGSNSGFTGRAVVGDGRFSRLRIDSEARLGANPASFTADQLELNRGVLSNTGNVTIDDANRGLRIGASAGIFDVPGGTTLTLAVPVSSPSSGNGIPTAPLYPNPVSGLLIKDNAGTLAFTHPNNSATNEIVINAGTLAVNGAGRINNGDHFMPITNNGTLSIATSSDQILSGVISGSGALQKGGSGTLTLTAANTLTGAVSVSGGTLYANPGNAATDRAFSQVSGITVNPGGTLRAGPNGLFGWDGTQARPITVNAGGTLTTDAAGTDVNVGSVTLNGGTLAGFASNAWGSWNFKRVGGAKLLVTEDSVVSAPNVGLGTSNSIDVSAGKTLTFSGAVTDLTNEGPCALVKSNGTGTLVLTGTHTYTGPSDFDAGTTLVNGSLGNTIVTVAAAATLGGSGSIAGPTTVNGTHRPGASAGTQSFGGTLGYGAASHLEWELVANSTSPGSFDQVNASGAVTITAGAVVDVVFDADGSTVALGDAFWTQPRQWTLLTAGSLSGSFQLGSLGDDPGGLSPSDYGVFSLVHDATSVTLDFVPYTPHEFWQQAHFGADWNNPAVAGDEIDGDKDGLGNLLERAFGGDPNVAEHDLLPTIDEGAGLLSIVYRKAVDAADLIFVVKESTSLSPPWDPASGTDVLLETVDGVEKRRFTRPAGVEERLFLRVEVERP